MIYDMDDFEINVFVTRKCNLDCSHCYIDTDVRKSSDYIKEEKLAKTLDEMERFFRVNNFKVINIGIYGGEVTQMDPDYLISIISLIEEKIKKYSPETSLGFKLSTNLVTKDIERFFPLFEKIEILGISYDLEVNRFNSWNSRLWENNLEKIQKLNKRITLNFTLTKNVIGKEQHFIDIIEKYNINSIHLGYYVPAGKNIDNGLRPTHREHSDFCKNIVGLLLSKGRTDMDISPIQGMSNALKNDNFDGGVICEIFNSINIDTNGLVTLCIAAGGNNSFPEQIVGNTNTNSMNTILNSKEYYKELLSMLNPNELCDGCEYQKICKQGCKILSEYGVEDGECWGYKSLWDYVKDNLDSLSNTK